MSLRPFLFWSHFIAGALAVLVLLPLSVTGVLLTYERQFIELAEQHYRVDRDASRQPLSADRVVAIAREQYPDNPHIFIRWVNRDGAAIPVWVGGESLLLDPYTGDVLRHGEGSVASALGSIRALHRWLLFSKESRDVGRAITAYANLLFIFLLLSGFYLWLPRRWRWKVVRRHVLLPKQHKAGKARLASWHYVFGIWSLLPLLVIALSATIFYFDWANKMLYAAYDEEVPAREVHTAPERIDYAQFQLAPLLTVAKQHAKNNGAGDWYSMWMELGEAENEVRFFIDRSIGHRPDYAYSLYLDIQTGNVLKTKYQSDWSRGDQAWDVARFLHTGEYFGFVGQTIAGLVSLLACISIYSGVVLGWRRLMRSNKQH